MSSKLTIVIPTYNEEHYLPNLLNSLKEQTFQDYEVIVADANSTDNTVKIAKKYNCKIVKGGSVSFGRNNGAKHAKSKYILFIDADIILKDKFIVEKTYCYLEQGYVVSSLIWLDNSILRIFNYLQNAWVIGNNLFFPHPYAAYFALPKELFHELEGFPEVNFGEDLIVAKKLKKEIINRKIKFKIICSKSVFTNARRINSKRRIAIILKEILGVITFIFSFIFLNKKIKFEYDLREYR